MKPSTSSALYLALIASAAMPAWSLAQDAPATQPAVQSATQPAPSPEGPPPPPPPQLISGILSEEFDTAYFKRGFLQENKGVIQQPMLDISLDPFHDIGPLSDLSFNIGTRESIHSNDTHAQDSPRSWYEADVFTGFSATFYKRCKFDMTYVDIMSPNDAFNTIQELDWQLTFIDDGLLGDLSFRPYITLVREIGQSAAGGPEGTYFEAGLEPAFPILKSRTFPIRLSFPTRVGLSLQNYYKLVTPVGLTPDETYGYAQTGITAMMPLTFFPHDYGMAFVSAGVDFLFLNHNLQLVNHNHDNAVIGRITFGWLF